MARRPLLTDDTIRTIIADEAKNCGVRGKKLAVDGLRKVLGEGSPEDSSNRSARCSKQQRKRLQADLACDRLRRGSRHRLKSSSS